MKFLNALTLDTVLGAHFDGNVHTIGGPQGDIKVDEPTYGLITAYVRHRSNTNEPRFFIAWSGKPSKNLTDEFKAFRTNLFVWLKRNTPNEDVRRNQSFQELIKCILVSLTTQCPTQAKVKELGVGGSAKNLCQMWRQKQKKLEMKQWLENFRKSPPTESECKKAIQDNAGWGRMTANSLLKLWESRCSGQGQPNLPAKDFRQYLGTGGKGWPNLVIRSNPISGRGLVAKVAFNEGDVVCDYHGNVYRATAGAWKQNADTSYLYCLKHNDKSWYVDATAEDGSYGRLINHSRTNPNLKTCVYREEGKPPTLLFVATKKIAPGTDLHYEYGDFSKNVPDWIYKT